MPPAVLPFATDLCADESGPQPRNVRVTPVRLGPGIDPAQVAAQVHLSQLIVYELPDVPGQIVVPATDRRRTLSRHGDY